MIKHNINCKFVACTESPSGHAIIQVTPSGENAIVLFGGANHEITAKDVMAALDDVAVSTGSACTSESVEPSYVLQALGLPHSISAGSIRIGFGRFTTQSEIDYAAQRIAAEVAAQRGSQEAAAE